MSSREIIEKVLTGFVLIVAFINAFENITGNDYTAQLIGTTGNLIVNSLMLMLISYLFVSIVLRIFA